MANKADFPLQLMLRAFISPRIKLGMIGFCSALVIIIVIHGLITYISLFQPDYNWLTLLLSLPVIYSLVCIFSSRFRDSGRSGYAVIGPLIVAIFVSTFVFFISYSVVSEKMLKKSVVQEMQKTVSPPKNGITSNQVQDYIDGMSDDDRIILTRSIRESGQLDFARRLSQLRSFVGFWLVMLVAGLWAALARPLEN